MDRLSIVQQAWHNVRREWHTMRRRQFHFLILFVTGRCNARCSFCFYWREREQAARDLTLDEFKRLSKTTPPFEILLLSGGEPFLRKDLADIVTAFHTHSGVRVAAIPTNGLLPEKIASVTAQILRDNPALSLGINLSLDALGTLHDEMRGVPQAFERVEESLARLARVKQEHAGRLQINLNTVICAANYNNVPGLARHAVTTYDQLDGHFFEIVRGDPQDKSVAEVSPHALRQVYEEIFPLQLTYFQRRRHGRFPLNVWRKMTYGGNLLYQYRAQYGNYVTGRKWNAPCLAGQTIAVVDYDGQVRACELHPPVGNLRDVGGDFNAIYHSDAMEAERTKARSHTCDCTHVCFITSSRIHSPRARYLSVPWLYLRYKLFGHIVP